MSEPREQIQSSVKALDQLPQSKVIQCSRYYQSKPMGPQDQADYVNAVVALETELSAQNLLTHTQAVEQTHGRVRKAHRWGPRTLDIDILLFGQQVLSTPELTIPHYGMKDREFVLYPLFEIAGGLVLPDGESIADLVALCPKNGLSVMEN